MASVSSSKLTIFGIVKKNQFASLGRSKDGNCVLCLKMANIKVLFLANNTNDVFN